MFLSCFADTFEALLCIFPILNVNLLCSVDRDRELMPDKFLSL